MKRETTLTGANTSDMEIVKKIKEEKCYVAQDFDAEMKAAKEQQNIERTY